MGHAHGPFCCQCLHGLARAAAFMVTVHHGTLTPVFGKDLLMTVMLWFKGEQQLLDFMDWLNDQHPTIKFMANYGTVDIPYLDVSLSIADGHISTDLHVKELGVKHQLTYSRQGDR